jgi:hypothetical protein
MRFFRSNYRQLQQFHYSNYGNYSDSALCFSAASISSESGGYWFRANGWRPTSDAAKGREAGL